MDFRQPEYFLAIVDHDGFTRASSALYVSQPSLSQAIRAMDDWARFPRRAFEHLTATYGSIHPFE